MNFLFNTIIGGNSLFAYIKAIVIFIFLLLIVQLIRKKIIAWVKEKSLKTKNQLDDFFAKILDKIFVPIAYFLCVYLSVNSLALPIIIKKVINISLLGLLVFFAAQVLVQLIDFLFNLYWIHHGKNVTLKRSLNGILTVLQVLIWGLAIVIFLDNIGIKVSTVIAGLGIGGVAVGLAAQAILKDIFSYFSILFDRPFEVGDFIIIGDYMGVVEYIGAKTTRIRSLGGEQIIFSNTDLTDSRVRNYKRMDQRRVVFKLGVVYQTPLEKMKKIPQIIKSIIENIPDTRFDRAHFFSFGDFSLIIEVVYYVLSNDYNKYMDIQQEINFQIMQEFEKENIEFAYPTQTIFLTKEGNSNNEN